ncbi:MAG TPA: hypothetical protein P5527_03975 [Kiritimatiellia bacterium]|nr:hypothetical protein [Kiritimatiellia bacterium]
MSGKRRWFVRIGRAGGMALAMFAAVGMVATQTARAEPGPSAVFHGRTDARVRFTGDWVPVVAPDKTLGRYAERSDTKGASVELDFCGTTVGLVHQAGGLGWEWGVIVPETGRALGLAEVRIDGGAPVVIDTSRGGRTLLAKGLPAGRHRVTVTNLGASRDPGGSGTIVVKGFWADAEEIPDDTARRAWLVADAVRGGEGWRARAAELAAAVKTADDLKRLEGLAAASREMEAAAEKLRRLTAEPPMSPMVERERRYWTPNRDTRAYLARLAALRKEADAPLTKADAFRYDEANRAAFTDVMTEMQRCAERIDAFFQKEVRQLPPILFFTGAPLKSGAAPNHIWQSQPLNNAWGCSIRTWEPAHPDRSAKVLFEEANSAIFDLNLSYDARTVFFSMRRDRAQCWQIYEMNVDGTGVRQITSGPHYNVSPVPLPDGRLAFISSRTPGTHTVCQSGPSTHVYVMNRDGSDVRRLSANTLSDFGLDIMADGRLLFTRWEYVDVTLTYRQSLWTQRPDGCQLLLWFGNTILDPATFWQAREIPGRYAAVCTFTSHHHTPHGAIGLVSNRNGPEAPRGTGFRWITREFPANLDLDTFWAYRDPYPVYENRYLISYGGGGPQRFRICLLDDMDNQAPVYEDPATSCFAPQPLRPRPVPTRLETTYAANPAVFPLPAAPPGQPTATNVPLGRLMLTDVYQGMGPEVARGQVTSIRIMEQMPKTVDRTWNFVMDQGPLMSASTYYAKRVWGYAPVEADGSAYFEAPALKELYLQACDAEGREVRRMTSVLQLMPGETLSCVGCHESRQSVAAASNTVPLATQRAPTPLTLPEWGNAGVLDYNRVVQPVLDRHCVKCHQGTDPPKGVLLTGDFTRFFNMSYDHLVTRTRSEEASRAHYTGRAAEKPMVQSLHLLYGIVKPFALFGSGSFVSRLPEFLQKAHCQTNIPAADRRRIYEWIDAMIPYYPTSDYARMEAKSNRDKWAHPDRKELLPWFTERFAPVYNRRCAACHGEAKGDLGLANPQQWSWLNLTRPAWSPALNAHLAKSAGGRGISAKDFMFRDTNDPDYQAMLAAITEGGKKAYEVPEADMPGFINRSQHRAFVYRPVAVKLDTLAGRGRKTASHCCGSDSVEAMTDGIVPAKSCDNLPRFSWYPRKGSVEWVQVDFPAPAPVSKVSVFWFSDRPTGGGCDTPQSWRLLYRHDNEWRPVEQPSGFDVASDRFNDGIFTRVTTTALRIEAQLKKDWSGGISEWRVE